MNKLVKSFCFYLSTPLLTQVLVLTLVLTLEGCGFSLKQQVDLPFTSIFVNQSELTPFVREFRKSVASSGRVEVITDPKRLDQAQVILEILPERTDQIILGRTAVGTINAYQLRLMIPFKLRTQDGLEIIPETEVSLFRDLSFNETIALSKEAEITLMFTNMRSEIGRQIMRRVATAGKNWSAEQPTH
jgi:LPS-assembly lipoprotein